MKTAKNSNRLYGDLSAAPSARFLWLSSTVLFVWHLVLWMMIARRQQSDFTSILRHWDAAWYLEIATSGYIQERAWAFYPGYPGVVALAIKLLPAQIPPQVVGSLLSATFFAGFICFLMACREARYLIGPATRLGWLVFLIFPCSYVFHSMHSESLFLLLAALTLYFFHRRRLIPSAFFAGLAALTRNEGVILAAALGMASIEAAGSVPPHAARFREGAKKFATFLLIGGGLWSLWLWFQWSQAGHPLMFLKAQRFWTPEVSVLSYARTFWFGNPWQNTNTGSIVHHLMFLSLLPGIYWYWRSSKNLPVTLFLVVFMLIRPLQGELVSTLRFETVLFPLLFFLGDRSAILKRRWQYFGLLLLLVLNWQFTRAYGLLRWPY